MIREEVREEKWQFPFVVYRPENMKENLPLIVQLHGAGEAGSGGEELCRVDVHGFSAILTKEAEFPCIVVLPQCKADSFWVAEISNIYQFVQALIDEYQIDSKRVYLTGLSMGGYGTWYTALRYPETFAAIVPVCGGGMVWKAAALDMPIWAFHGTEDGTVPVTETLNMIQKIRTVGKNKDVKVTILDNVGHNAWDYAYTSEVLEWLLSKSR